MFNVSLNWIQHQFYSMSPLFQCTNLWKWYHVVITYLFMAYDWTSMYTILFLICFLFNFNFPPFSSDAFIIYAFVCVHLVFCGYLLQITCIGKHIFCFCCMYITYFKSVKLKTAYIYIEQMILYLKPDFLAKVSNLSKLCPSQYILLWEFLSPKQ